MRRKGVMRGDVQDRCEELQDSSPLTSTILGSSEGGGGGPGCRETHVVPGEVEVVDANDSKWCAWCSACKTPLPRCNSACVTVLIANLRILMNRCESLLFLA